MSETVKRFKPTLQTATQTSHGAYGSNANSPSSPLPRSPMQLTDSPASYFHLATSPVSAAGSGAGSGTGSSVASVPSATTPSESKASGGFGFNMSSLFGRSKTSGERHLSISLPRPKIERLESNNISPGSVFPPDSTPPSTSQGPSNKRPSPIIYKPFSGSPPSYFQYKGRSTSREEARNTIAYGMNLSSMGPLGDYRRDLKVLQGPSPAGGSGTSSSATNGNGYNSSNPTLTQTPPSASPTGQTWKNMNNSSSYAINGSDANFGVPSVLDDVSKSPSSPGFDKHGDVFSHMRGDESPQMTRHAYSVDYSSSGNPIEGYFTDDRRPSVASVNTTASSTGSKTSLGKRLKQGIFGDGESHHHHHHFHQPQPFNNSNSNPITPPHINQSDTNLPGQKLFHPATTPVSTVSRPRTPQPPSSDVVPFLFQDANDIQQFGEAPIQNQLINDKHRYLDNDMQSVDPKSSGFFSRKADKSKTPAKPRGRDYDGGASDKEASGHRRDLFSTPFGGSTTNLPRASSPSPSVHSINSGQASSSAGHNAAASSTTEKTTKRSFLKGMLKGRDKKPKDEEPEISMPISGTPRKPAGGKNGEVPPGSSSGKLRPEAPKRGGPTAPLTTLGNATLSSHKPKKRGDSLEKYNSVVPPETTGMLLDIFDLTNMEGIIQSEPRLLNGQPTHGSWNAPDSWAVGRESESGPQDEADEGLEDAKRKPSLQQFCIRVFRVDGSFTTLSSNLQSSVTELLHQLGKKSFLQDDLSNYVIILRKGDMARILGSNERPLLMQKKLLEQVGYTDEDRLDEIGREDNSYLCRFTFLPSRVSGHSLDPDKGFNNYKYNHVDLSGRNLLTIPIAFYLKANEISSLNLSRNLSLQVPQDFIQACSNLKEVKFRNNEAWDLPSSFAHIQKLTYMDISNNRLKNLSNAKLHKHEGLVALKMANNRIQELPEEFSKFHSLRGLNIASNYLPNIPPLVSTLLTLVELDLSFNRITEVPEELSSLKALERLILSHNKIAGDLPAAMIGLRSLKELDIRHNNITSVDVLLKLERLETLFAGHNEMPSFSCGFEKLRTLHLNSNKLTSFNVESSSPALTCMIVSDNQIAVLGDNFCESIPNMERLIVDRNKLTHLPARIGKLKKLTELRVAGNHLNNLPPEIGQLVELRELDLHDNDLSTLPPEIWSMVNLTILNLSSNCITTFPKPQNISIVTPSVQSASDNLLSADAVNDAGSPHANSRKSSFASVSNNLNLRKSSIVSKSSDATTLVGSASFTTGSRKDSMVFSRTSNTFASSLRNLYLADNRFTDEAFDEISLLVELRVLNLSYNRIYDIPSRSLTKLSCLSELYLSGNELTSLPTDDLEHISTLKILHLNSNKFQTLPAELGKIRHLHVLDVGSNALKYNISNWPYDWNWNWNLELRYLNLSGNRRLEIKANLSTHGPRDQSFTDFNALKSLRVLGLMDVTTTNPSFPDESEDCRVRTSGTQIKNMMYGMADSLGKNEHLSMVDMVVPRFRGNEDELVFGFYDGQVPSHLSSKIAKFLQEQTIYHLQEEMRKLRAEETPATALRRAFISMNRDLLLTGLATNDEKSLSPRDRHRGTTAGSTTLTKDDIQLGASGVLVYIKEHDMYVANVGDAMGLLVQNSGEFQTLTTKHDPLTPSELERIRDAGGYVSRGGKINDHLELSRAFGYHFLIPNVQACPSVKHWKITEQDEFLILASKELWDHLSYKNAVYIATQEKGDLMLTAQKLRDIAIAYGASKKIMCMIVGVGDLVKQRRRTGRSMSIVAGMEDDPSARRGNRKRPDAGDDDSRWRKFGREIPPPEGDVCLVFTDIKGSTLLWETYSNAMRSAIKIHNDIMRELLRTVGGYEVKTEGDAFMVAFPTVTSALLWTFNVQVALLTSEAWPAEILRSQQCGEVWASDNEGVNSLTHRGLSVRMGIHFGQPVCERDPITKRMDYFGPMVNRAARIQGVADGGQITVSSDYLTELKKLDALYPPEETAMAPRPSDAFGDVTYEDAIKNDLRTLRNSNGWIIKELGERKLKGLENPELISLIFPPSLAARESDKVVEKTSPSETGLTSELVLPLYDCALRLEKLCSALSTAGLKSEFMIDGKYSKEMLQKKIQEGGTDPSVLEFVEGVITRIESSITTLYLRSIMKNIPNVDNTATGENAEPSLKFGSSITQILGSLKALLETDPRLQTARNMSSTRSNSNASALDSTTTDGFQSEDYDDCEIIEPPFPPV